MISPLTKDHVKVSNHHRCNPIYVSMIDVSALPPITTTTITEPPTTTTTTTLAPPDPEFGCDFEDGTSCQWIPKEQPWPITSGGEGGPSVDHTTHNGETNIMNTESYITCISYHMSLVSLQKRDTLPC